ncbi:37128_t:CDS:2 [Gigaspora margarita]|uniref:37128_t:CDS:1 n=1 Tax=Gigaspora margarita TaxID=4874 RepID=A0ABN7V7N4_GIGMA|nr:37128_t:CDS:2 [Gigaspora margarita]
MGVSIYSELANETYAIYTYHLQEAVYHRIGSLLLDENCIPNAGQSVRRGQPITLRLLSSQGFDIRRYNYPTANEIAVLLIDNNANRGYDILLCTI